MREKEEEEDAKKELKTTSDNGNGPNSNEHRILHRKGNSQIMKSLTKSKINSFVPHSELKMSEQKQLIKNHKIKRKYVCFALFLSLFFKTFFSQFEKKSIEFVSIFVSFSSWCLRAM